MPTKIATSPGGGQDRLPPLLLMLPEAPPACLYCAATQATVRRQRQILDARLGDSAPCVCCDGETSYTCPLCLGQNLEYASYDFDTDTETGYADSGERYWCRDCGATGDAEDTAVMPAMLAPPTRKPMTPACGQAELPQVA
jgi:hypothetical protein